MPDVKEIGLWGPKIRKAYGEMGILGYADVDAEALQKQDEQLAEQVDAGYVPGLDPERLQGLEAVEA